MALIYYKDDQGQISCRTHIWKFNTLRPHDQNGHHVADYIFNCIFKENVWIVIQIWSTNFSKSFLLMVKLSKS